MMMRASISRPFHQSSRGRAVSCWLATLLLAIPSNAVSVRAEVSKAVAVDPDMIGTWDFPVDPSRPNVLLIGDSISVSYTRPVRELLKGKANVFRPMSADGKLPANCGDTRLSLPKIDEWLGNRKWDVIHFNWGLHDCCYRNPAVPTPGHQDKVDGSVSIPLPRYAKNLEQLAQRLASTGATLVWASTTVVPEGDVGRFVGDEATHNGVAAAIARRHGIAINDLHALTKSFAGKYSLGPGDVHFTPEGSAKIARQVATAITQALTAQRPAPKP